MREEPIYSGKEILQCQKSSHDYQQHQSGNKVCPQVSCCGLGFWNIQYNSLLNLEYSTHTKVIAFADGLLVMTRKKTILKAENFTNSNLHKATHWAFKNKNRFNEQKSTAILMTQKRRTSINIFLNNKQIEVWKFKYLGIISHKKFIFHQHIQYTAQNWSTHFPKQQN